MHGDQKGLRHLCCALIGIAAIGGGSSAHAQPTVGGGTLEAPAAGPAPAYGLGGDGFVLVKNWDFGAAEANTISNMSEMSEHFQYLDQFGTIANGTKYGSLIVAPDQRNDLKHLKQPIEGVNTDRPVRAFTADSLKTYLVPLDGADRVHPTHAKAGSGSFQAKWTLEKGGSRLGRDLLWETRVRYKTPPYFWFAIWTAGNRWNKGAEIDVVESFGYDNGGGYTNDDGRFWHSNVVGGTDDTEYHSNWRAGMASRGVTEFGATQWHVWTLLYRADDTYSIYLDGVEVQSGRIEWTLGGKPNGEPLNMSFIFDGAWGHRQIRSVNHWLPASQLEDVFYEWDYSRVYLGSKASATAAAP